MPRKKKKIKDVPHLFISRSSADNVLDELTDLAVEALYYDYSGRTYSPSYWNKDWLREEVKESQERGYIEGAEGDDITPNKNNPRIPKAIKKLDKIEHFLGHCSTDFDEAFIEKHEIQPEWIGYLTPETNIVNDFKIDVIFARGSRL